MFQTLPGPVHCCGKGLPRPGGSRCDHCDGVLCGPVHECERAKRLGYIRIWFCGPRVRPTTVNFLDAKTDQGAPDAPDDWPCDSCGLAPDECVRIGRLICHPGNCGTYRDDGSPPCGWCSAHGVEIVKTPPPDDLAEQCNLIVKVRQLGSITCYEAFLNGMKVGFMNVGASGELQAWRLDGPRGLVRALTESATKVAPMALAPMPGRKDGQRALGRRVGSDRTVFAVRLRRAF